MMTTNQFLAGTAAVGTAMTALCAGPELLWDTEMILEMTGGAALVLHHPEPREIAIVHDAPWEGNVCCYHTVLYDGKKYRMYYRGRAANLPGYGKHEVTCYAESDDGILWVKPKLGICEFAGSKENNIILIDVDASHNFSPCLDTNPDCPPEQRFKALGGMKHGLFLFHSPDGIHWVKSRKDPVITRGAFDSQNTIFYDTVRRCYTAYSRLSCKGRSGTMLRAIQRQTSSDAIRWSEPELLNSGDTAPDVELYTNAIHPYWYNPAVLIGLPKRFVRDRASVYDHSGGGGLPGVSDGLFMSSRDGIHFHRRDEAFVRPGIQHERWVNRNNMSAQGVVPTRPLLEGTPPELSIYSTEGYYGDRPNRLRRLAIRQDGFVSVQAPMSGGAFTMKPLAVDGKKLLLNASTSGAGEIRCEIRDEKGVPLPGYTLVESVPVFGDELELEMKWRSGSDLAPLAGRRVILHFELKDADIYSLSFKPRGR